MEILKSCADAYFALSCGGPATDGSMGELLEGEIISTLSKISRVLVR